MIFRIRYHLSPILWLGPFSIVNLLIYLPLFTQLSLPPPMMTWEWAFLWQKQGWKTRWDQSWYTEGRLSGCLLVSRTPLSPVLSPTLQGFHFQYPEAVSPLPPPVVVGASQGQILGLSLISQNFWVICGGMGVKYHELQHPFPYLQQSSLCWTLDSYIQLAIQYLQMDVYYMSQTFYTPKGNSDLSLGDLHLLVPPPQQHPQLRWRQRNPFQC